MSASTIDCVIPVHQKDIQRGRLARCVAGLRRNVEQVARIFLVTDPAAGDAARAMMSSLGETRYELVSERDFIPPDARPSAWWQGRFSATGRRGDPSSPWFLQQLIKLEGFRLVSTDHYLVVDADLFFLNPTKLIDDAGRVTFARDAARATFRSHPMVLPCRSFCSVAHHLTGAAPGLHPVCHIAHHMVFHVETLRELQRDVGGDWRAAIARVSPVTEEWSEYDLYAAYVMSRYPSRCAYRTAPWVDVPWTGAYDRRFDEYLGVYASAGLSFVAHHHHHDDAMTDDDCFEFAHALRDRLTAPGEPSDETCQGRWPLAQWLTLQQHRRGVGTAETPSSRSDGLVQAVSEACHEALARIIIRHAHVRGADGFLTDPAAYERPALEALRHELAEIDHVVSLLGPRAPDWETAMDAVNAIVARPSPEPRELALRLDDLHQASARTFELLREREPSVARIPVPGLIAIIRFVGQQTPEIFAMASQCRRILGDAEWQTVLPHLEGGPMLQERLRSRPFGTS